MPKIPAGQGKDFQRMLLAIQQGLQYVLRVMRKWNKLANVFQQLTDQHKQTTVVQYWVTCQTCSFLLTAILLHDSPFWYQDMAFTQWGRSVR